MSDIELDGVRGRIVARVWDPAESERIALIAHGYGEHSGRYLHVGEALADAGFAVYAPDHLGHGRSEGERVLVEDIEDIVEDLHRLSELAAREHSGLPTVLVGHSLGGMIAARYAQLHGEELQSLVLSGPAFGGNPEIEALLGLDPIPDVPIDPAILSRDPAVGERYANDPLVWHGPFKRPTLEASFAMMKTIAEGPSLGPLPVLWLHGDQDQLCPIDLAREAVRRLAGDSLEERVYTGAQHEVLNETNNDEVIGDLLAFVRAA